MSQVYVQEPATSGKIVLVTNHGEIEIELWAKETPKTCRNFIQLCVEGYYDNTIFFRLIPGFMIQGGDPTGSGMGGQSIYGEKFQDEFHQRLKFTHRGIVAMANEDKPNDNGSQFFITYDKCEWLNKKHTIFGKVVGDTLYNLMATQSLDTNENDRPINPPKILSTRVVLNPFDDIIVRSQNTNNNEEKQEKSNDSSDIEQEQQQKELLNTKKDDQQQKIPVNKVNQNLLSFGDDDDLEDVFVDKKQIQISQQDKMKSSHDVLDNPLLSKQLAVDINQLDEKKRKQQEEEEKKIQFKQKIQQVNKGDKDSNNNDNIGDQIKKKRFLEINEEIKSKIANLQDNDLKGYKTRKNKKTGQLEIYWQNSSEGSEGSLSGDQESYSSTDSEEFINEDHKKIRDKQKEEYENLRIDILKFKKEKIGTNNQELIAQNKEEKKLLSNLEKRKEKFMNDIQLKKHEDDVVSRLNKFKQLINSEDVKKQAGHWVNHRLKFHIDSQRAYFHSDIKDKVKEYNVEEDFKAPISRPIFQSNNNVDEDLQLKSLDSILSVDQLIEISKTKNKNN